MTKPFYLISAIQITVYPICECLWEQRTEGNLRLFLRLIPVCADYGYGVGCCVVLCPAPRGQQGNISFPQFKQASRSVTSVHQTL